MLEKIGVTIIGKAEDYYRCPNCGRAGKGSFATYVCPAKNEVFRVINPTVGPDGLPSAQTCPTSADGVRPKGCSLPCSGYMPALSYKCTVCEVVTEF
jgi:hypothetical protein